MINVCKQSKNHPLTYMTPGRLEQFWETQLRGIDPQRWTRPEHYYEGSVCGPDYFAHASSYDGALGRGHILADLSTPSFVRSGMGYLSSPMKASWQLHLEDYTVGGHFLVVDLEVTQKGKIFTRELTLAPGLPLDRFANSMWVHTDLQRVYLASTEIPDQWDKWERPKPEGMHSPFLQWLTELPWGVNSDFDYDAYYPTWLERVQTKQAEASVAVA
jgi:hypothetical protein